MVSWSRELGLATPHLGVHTRPGDDALEVTLGTDRQLVGITLAPKRSSWSLRRSRVRADLVHLVDEADAGPRRTCGPAARLLGLRLDTLLAVKTATGTSSTRRLRSTSTVSRTCRGCR